VEVFPINKWKEKGSYDLKADSEDEGLGVDIDDENEQTNDKDKDNYKENTELFKHFNSKRWRPIGKVIGIVQSPNWSNEMICKLKPLGEEYRKTDKFIFGVLIDNRFLWMKLSLEDAQQEHKN